MKKLSLNLVIILFFSVLTVSAFAKKDEAKHDIKVGIKSHALVGISATSLITLEPEAPDVAGEGLDFTGDNATNSTIWLNYSSIVDKSANSISVSMDGDKLPDGVTIELVASEDAGNGLGEVGNSANEPIELEKNGKELISSIGNCFTGNGSGSGHQLTYSLKMNETNDNYKALTVEYFNTTITYTITDN